MRRTPFVDLYSSPSSEYIDSACLSQHHLSMATMSGAAQGIPDEDQGPVILGATLTVTIAALMTMVTRLYVRLVMIRNVGWDDYVMITAMLLVSQIPFVHKTRPTRSSSSYVIKETGSTRTTTTQGNMSLRRSRKAHQPDGLGPILPCSTVPHPKLSLIHNVYTSVFRRKNKTDTCIRNDQY